MRQVEMMKEQERRKVQKRGIRNHQMAPRVAEFGPSTFDTNVIFDHSSVLQPLRPPNSNVTPMRDQFSQKYHKGSSFDKVEYLFRNSRKIKSSELYEKIKE